MIDEWYFNLNVTQTVDISKLIGDHISAKYTIITVFFQMPGRSLRKRDENTELNYPKTLLIMTSSEKYKWRKGMIRLVYPRLERNRLQVTLRWLMHMNGYDKDGNGILHQLKCLPASYTTFLLGREGGGGGGREFEQQFDCKSSINLCISMV